MLGFKSGSGISSTITLSVGSTFGGIAGDGSTFTISQSGGTWTIKSTGTVAAGNGDFEAASREVAFMEAAGHDPTAGGADPNRQFIWTVVDNNTNTSQNTFVSGTRNADGSITSNTGDAGFSLVNVQHSATVSAGNTQNYLEGGGSVIIEPLVTFGDTDTITQAQVALPATEFQSSTDSIGFLSGTSLSTTFTFAKGTTVTGLAGDGSQFTIAETSNGVFTITSVAVAGVTVTNIDFEVAAREVAYLNTGDPTSAPGQGVFGTVTSRDFIWSITDTNSGTNTFASGTRGPNGNSIIDNPAIDSDAPGGSIISVFHKAPVLGVGGR